MTLASDAARIALIAEQQQINSGAHPLFGLFCGTAFSTHAHHRHAGSDSHAFHELTPVYIPFAQGDNLVNFRFLIIVFIVSSHPMHPFILLCQEYQTCRK
jgi:hypothetical protein